MGAHAPQQQSGSVQTGGVFAGRFHVLRRIGEGGMGTVYLARHLGLDRLIALKVLGSDTSGESLSRFQTEARAIARIRHPHVVEIYDYGKLEPGPAFISMEALPGIDL